MLRDHLEGTGQTLFRWRGVLPCLVLFAVPSAFAHFQYPFRDHAAQEIWTCVCLGIAVLGQAIRFVTLGYAPPRTSGRNRKAQVAEVLNTDGMYSIVRNPLYLGNCLTWMALAAVPRSPWPWIVVALVFWLYHERVILAEEAFLLGRFGDTYRHWAAATPAFLPRLRLWRTPARAFSFRAALGREYTNLFATISGFVVFEGLADSLAEHRVHLDLPWATAWGVALGLFLILRFLKKRTGWLTAPHAGGCA